MADLSTLANGFSVLGLADVVCRASIQLYGLMQGLRNAPARQQRYLGVLRDLTLTATQVRLWVENHEKSTSSVREGQRELQGVSTILKGSEDQIRQLTACLAPSKASTWLGRWRSVVGFTWDETLFQDAFDLLEKNNNCLSILLQLCSLKNGFSLSREMKTVSANFQELRNILFSSDSTVRHDLCALRDQIQLQIRSTASISELQLLSQKIGESSEQLKKMRDDQHLHYSKLDNTLVRQAGLHKSLLSALQDPSRIPALAMNGPVAIFAATQRIEANLVRPAAVFEESSHPHAPLHVRNPDQVLLSLMLIRPRLLSCIQKMAEEVGMHLSQPEVSWVQSEFELLQRSAAFLLVDPTVSEKDLWSCKSQSYTFQPRFKDVQFRHKYADKTARGLLITESSVVYDGARESQEAIKFHEYRFACITHPPECEPSGLLVAFHRKQDVLMTRSPQITRSLRELTIVPYDSLIYSYAANNHVGKMREMFRKREASPFDYTPNGTSLLGVAALRRNYEAMEFLLEQGADPFNCDLRESGVHDILDVMADCRAIGFNGGCICKRAEDLRRTETLISKRGFHLPKKAQGPKVWICIEVASYFNAEEPQSHAPKALGRSAYRDLNHDQKLWSLFSDCVREVLDLTMAAKGPVVFLSRPVLSRLALCYYNAAEPKFNTCFEFPPDASMRVELTPGVLEGLTALEEKARETGMTSNCRDDTEWFGTELEEIFKKGEVLAEN